MKNVRALGALFALAALGAACRRAAPASAGFEAYRQAAGIFSAEYPKGWLSADIRSAAPEQALFLSPTGSAPSPASLWVLYYPPGDPVYPKAEDFLAAEKAPGQGRAAGAPEDKTLGGKKYRVFWVERPQSRSPESLQSAARVRETQAVLETESGFFVLGLTRPLGSAYWDQRAAELDADFAHLLSSFEPSPPAAAKKSS